MSRDFQYTDGVKYSGELLDGRPDGVGKIVFPNESVLLGEFRRGEPCGRAEIVSGTACMTAEFKDGVATLLISHEDGPCAVVDATKPESLRAAILYKNGSIYMGEVSEQCSPQGYGIQLWPAHLWPNVRMGPWEEGTPVGDGLIFPADGTVLRGEWRGGVLTTPESMQVGAEYPLSSPLTIRRSDLFRVYTLYSRALDLMALDGVGELRRLIREGNLESLNSQTLLFMCDARAAGPSDSPPLHLALCLALLADAGLFSLGARSGRMPLYPSLIERAALDDNARLAYTDGRSRGTAELLLSFSHFCSVLEVAAKLRASDSASEEGLGEVVEAVCALQEVGEAGSGVASAVNFQLGKDYLCLNSRYEGRIPLRHASETATYEDVCRMARAVFGSDPGPSLPPVSILEYTLLPGGKPV